MDRGRVPRVCVLDPYGDIARFLARTGRGRRDTGWAGFHTELWTTGDRGLGVVTGAIGAAWAVFVAEQLAARGARVLVSISPAVPVHPPGSLPALVLIDRALRDEAVSGAYRPAARWSRLDPVVAARLAQGDGPSTGAAWSTAAPCRGPALALARTGPDRVACVDTEAAALYAHAEGGDVAVVCLAHLDRATTIEDRVVTWGPGLGGDHLLAVAAAVADLVDRERSAGSGRLP